MGWGCSCFFSLSVWCFGCGFDLREGMYVRVAGFVWICGCILVHVKDVEVGHVEDVDLSWGLGMCSWVGVFDKSYDLFLGSDEWLMYVLWVSAVLQTAIAPMRWGRLGCSALSVVVVRSLTEIGAVLSTV